MFDRGIQLTFHSFCEKKLQGMTPIPQSDEKGKEMISGSRYKSHLAERNEVWNKSFACKTALEDRSLTYARQCLACNKPCCEQWAPRIYYALFVTVFIFRRNNGALNKEIGCPIGHPSKNQWEIKGTKKSVSKKRTPRDSNYSTTMQARFLRNNSQIAAKQNFFVATFGKKKSPSIGSPARLLRARGRQQELNNRLWVPNHQ